MVIYCKHCGERMELPNNTLRAQLSGPDLPPVRQLSDDGAICLAKEIVSQVIREYRQQYRRLRKNPRSTDAMRAVMELRDEIMSEHFHTLSLGLDGEVIISMVEDLEEGKI